MFEIFIEAIICHKLVFLYPAESRVEEAKLFGASLAIFSSYSLDIPSRFFGICPKIFDLFSFEALSFPLCLTSILRLVYNGLSFIIGAACGFQGAEEGFMASITSGRCNRLSILFIFSLAIILFVGVLSPAEARRHSVSQLPPLVSAPPVVHIEAAGHEAPFMMAPYVGADGQIYAPIEAIFLMGAQYEEKSPTLASITSSSGKTFNATIYTVSGRQLISFLPVAEQLGAVTDWDKRTNILNLRAKVLLVKVDDGKALIVTSYPVEYETGALDNPHRAYIDLLGVALGSQPTDIPVDNGAVAHIRSNQMTADTVRIALDMSQAPSIALGRGKKSSLIEVSLSADLTVTSHIATGDCLPDLAANDQRARITAVQYLSNALGGPAVVITTNGKVSDAQPHTEWIGNPYRFAVDFPAAVLNVTGENQTGQIPAADTNIKDARWGYYSSSKGDFARIVLDMRSMADASIKIDSAPDGSWRKFTVSLSGGAPQINKGAADNAPVPGNLPSSGDVRPLDPVASGNIKKIPLIASPPVAGHAVNGGTPAAASPLVPSVPAIPTPAPPTPAPTAPAPTQTSQQAATVPSVPSAKQSPAQNDLFKDVVVILDPGHGGDDTGAVGAGNIFEKDIDLAIALKVRDGLIQLGAKPIMTRDADTAIRSVSLRTQDEKERNAAIFVSIHCESALSIRAASGSTVYYHSDRPQSRQLARLIAARLKSSDDGIACEGAMTDRRVISRPGYSVLRSGVIPSALVECGYLDSNNDISALQSDSRQTAIASAIVSGMEDFARDRNEDGKWRKPFVSESKAETNRLAEDKK